VPKCGHLAGDIRIAVDGRAKRRLEIGRDVPGNAEIKRLFDATAGQPKMRALLLIAAFTGLRASELRGFRWYDVDLKNRELHRAAAGGLLWRHRQSEVEDQPAHHPARFRRADYGLEGMEARLSEERT
jgi:integrase